MSRGKMVGREEWSRLARALMALPEPFTLDGLARAWELPKDRCEFRLASLRARHGRVLDRCEGPSCGRAAWWRLTVRGAVVLEALANGSPVPPQPSAPPPKLSAVEAAYRELRAKVAMAEPEPEEEQGPPRDVVAVGRRARWETRA